MFRGLYDTTIDSKGRTRMPVRFRESLAKHENLILEKASPRSTEEASEKLASDLGVRSVPPRPATVVVSGEDVPKEVKGSTGESDSSPDLSRADREAEAPSSTGSEETQGENSLDEPESSEDSEGESGKVEESSEDSERKSEGPSEDGDSQGEDGPNEPVKSEEKAEQPASEPEELRFMVTTSIDPCLIVYPMSEWEIFEQKLASLPQFDPAVVMLKRVFVAGATECTLDKHGRLMIPSMLREHMGLQKDVVWAGLVQTAEIWAKEEWIRKMEEARSDKEAIAKALKDLGL